MLEDLFKNNTFLYVIVGVFILGVITKVIVVSIYHSLIRNSKKMGTSNNKLMRTVRLKFETCYKLKIGVNNVDIFVDKYVYRYKVCGILLYTWETFSGFLMIVPALIGSTAAGLGIIYESGQTYILSTFLAGLFASVILLVVDYCYNIRAKRIILRTNMKDYLENFLKVRLEDSSFDPTAIETYRIEYEDQIKGNQKQKKDKNVPEVKSVSSQDSLDKKKEAAKKSLEDKARERREAKKNELKRMIEDDKKRKQAQTIKQSKTVKQEQEIKKDEKQPEIKKNEKQQEVKKNEKQPEVKKSGTDIKEKTVEAEKESAVTMNDQSAKELSGNGKQKEGSVQGKNSKELVVSKEDEKLIQSILNEFFGE